MSDEKLPRRQALVRRFVSDAFDDEGLEIFCYDYFPDVRKAFSDGMGFSKKVLILLEWCEHNGRFEELLAALKAERPDTFPASLDAPVEVPAVEAPVRGRRAHSLTVQQADDIQAAVRALSQYAAQNGYYLPFQTIYAELRTRFDVSSYKRLKQAQFEPVLEFLEEWRQRLVRRE